MKFGAVDHPDDTFKGPWLDNRTAAAYVPCRSLKAFWQWKRRHKIITVNGAVAKADIDRARLKKKKTRAGHHPNSRANLLKRHVA